MTETFSRRDLGLALLITIAVWAIAQAVWPLLGLVIPWDAKLQFFPFFRFLGESLADGSLPLWNPYHYAGHPSIADPQSLVFNPIFLLLAWLWPGAPMHAFDLAVGLHLLLAGIATVFIAQRWGFGAAGAALAAIVIMLGGSASARLQHIGQIVSYSWFIVSFALLLGALEERSFWRSALFGVTAGLMAAGRDQVAYLGALLLLAYALGDLLFRGAPLQRLVSRLPVLLVMAVIGGALIALPVLLTAQFAAISNRPAFNYDFIVAGSLYPVNFSNLFAANIFGALNNPYNYWGPGYETRPWVDATDRSINTIFAGSLPVLLLLWIGLAGQKLLARALIPLLILTVFSAAYALGHFTPLFPFLFQHLPGVDLWRRPADASFLMNIGIALLAGAMLGRYVEEGRPALKPIGAILAAAAVLSAFGFALWFSTRLDKVPLAGLEIGIAVGIFAVLLILMLRPALRFERATLAMLLVIATGAELVWRYAGSAINAEPVANYASYATPDQAEAAARKVILDEMALRHAAGEYPRAEFLGLGGTGQNVSMLLPVENTLGYNPLRIGDYDHLVAPGQNNGWIGQRQFPPSFPSWESDLAKRLGLEYLVLGAPLAELPALFPQPKNAVLIHAGPPWWIYKLPPALPRAVLATRAVRGDQALLNGLADYLSGIDPDRATLDASAPVTGNYGAPDAAAGDGGSVKI